MHKKECGEDRNGDSVKDESNNGNINVHEEENKEESHNESDDNESSGGDKHAMIYDT